MNIIKKLPKIYQNKINKKIKNNKEVYYISLSNNKEENVTKTNDIDIELILDGIFSGKRQAYNIPVIIKTNTKVYDTFLVARTSNYILTIDQDRIKPEEIIYIKRKNP